MDQSKLSEKEKCDKECIENENMLSTLSTGKCSTDQLICKTPLESPAGASASPCSISDQFIERSNTSNVYNNAALAFALLQIALGIIISVCGFFIYSYNMASGLWAGPIVISTGILGTITQYRASNSDDNKRHLLHTWYLILGLVSFALSQLSLVLTAIGLTRLETSVTRSVLIIPQPLDDFLQLTVEMEKALVHGLLITVMVATAFECLAAATGVYLQARASLKLWCCATGEKKHETSLLGTADINGKDTMLRSWLGKLQSPPMTGTVSTKAATVYMVPTTLSHFKRANGKQTNKPYIRTVQPTAMVPGLVPVHVMQMPQLQHQQLVPILPAPPPSFCPQSIPPYHPYAAYTNLRPPPPLVVRPAHYRPVQLVRRHTTTSPNCRQSAAPHYHQRMMQEQQHEMDMACVYTGLDRDIAEQYIQCCDSRKSTIISNSTGN